MRTKIVAGLAVVVLALAGIGGWYWWDVLRFRQSTDDAYVQSDVTLISPKIEGYIKKVKVADNQEVAEGAILFVIDDRDFKAKAAQAEAAVATTEAMIATYESRLKLQEAMIDQAAAVVKSAEADLSRAQQDYKRYSSLMTSDFASRQRFEQAEADARKAEAALAKSRAAYAAEQNQLAVLQSQRREEEARLQQARANLWLAKNDLDNTVIRAPISGVAGNRAGQVGQYVKPGTQLLSLVPLPQVYVTANFKETQLTRMRPGQLAEVSVDAYPDQVLEGRIESFAPASGAQFSLLPPDNATGNFTKIVQRVPVRIALPASGPLAGLLRPGLSVTVTIDTRNTRGRRDGRRGPGQVSMSALRDDASPRIAPTLPSPASGGGLGLHTSPSLRDWLGVLAMVVGLFMAIMDVQIVTSSLTQIQGGLAASTDEISWVQTSYLIADVVMVPLSGTLSRLLSTRVLFVIAALGFTGASALCATATSLGQMIVYRALQGFSGGAMMPLVFPVVYTKFRMPQLAQIMVLIGLILNLSSTLGPTIGGYLTDTFSWHWLFLVNIVPGIAVAGAVWVLIDIDKPEVSLLRHFDFCGLVLMALFLGCLQYALQEGPRWDWLSDGTILTAVIVSSIASVLFFWRVLTYHQPIVDLRAFTNRNFALGSFYTFVVGTGLYGTTYLVPLFLAQVRGFNSLQIGETVVVTGLAQMLMSPISSQLTRRMDLRLMLSIGIGLFAVAMYLTAGLTNQAGYAELFVPQVLRGVALMMCYLPANMIALGSVPPDKLKNSAGLYNLTRDLGGAIALATIGTLMNERLHFHWNRLIEDINPARPAVQHFLDMQAGRLDALVPGDTGRAAVKLLANLVQREALVMTYNDAIMMVGACSSPASF